MRRRVVTALGLIFAVATCAAAQEPSRAAATEQKVQWVLSVVHTVELNKVVNRLKRGYPGRVGVLPSAPQTILNVATAIAIDEQGHVVTRLAYVDPQDKDQKLSIITADGRTLSARLVGVDCATGFSVLDVPSLKVSPPRFLDGSKLANGAAVKILSADYVQKTGSPDKGSEVYISPSIRVSYGQVGTDSIYSTARGALTLFSSGLLSRNDSSIVTTPAGLVVGMAQFAGHGRAYLFTIETIRDIIARRVLEKKDSVPAGWLGLSGDSLAQLTDAERGALGVAGKSGVVVREIAPDSPAATSGVMLNDVIVGVDNFSVTGAADLSALLSSTPAGSNVRLRTLRNRQPVEISVALGARAYNGAEINFGGSPIVEPINDLGDSLASERGQVESRYKELTDQYRSYLARKDIPIKQRKEALHELEIEIRQLQDKIRELDQRGVPGPLPRVPNVQQAQDTVFPLGFVSRDLTPQLAGFFGAKSGVLVVSVSAGSRAESAGLKVGDVIVGTQERESLTSSELKAILYTLRGEITVKALRDKKPVVVNLKNQ
jgi:S1-C subfamily serine protease